MKRFIGLTIVGVCLIVGSDRWWSAQAEPAKSEQAIKAFCLDFNWAGRRGFAKPGTWKDADPAAHIAWHKMMGVNVIQTFCVSSNGWAWYKNGVVPEQPGLKHDFLREMVKLGHAEGMKVMGYFTIGANTRWGQANPNLSYGTPSTYHIPYTDAYLKYVDAAISDAVKTTGIDGFMIDWVWQPRRQSTKGKWIEAEKELYEQLMGEPFPGEDKLTGAKNLEYSRKAIDRCWKTIHKAAKSANPDVIIWLTCNNMRSATVTGSDMFKQVDWLMAEAGNIEHLKRARAMVGEQTRLITCMAQWNGQDPTKAVPEAIAHGVGLYGFAKPRNGMGVIPLEGIFTRQVSELSGDDQNIAVLARAYHGASIHSQWVDGKFVEPESVPPFDIRFKRRGRGWQDTGRIDHDAGSATVTIRQPYESGRAQLTRTGERWPKTIMIRLSRAGGDRPHASALRIANGSMGYTMTIGDEPVAAKGKFEGRLDLGRPWGEKFVQEPGEPMAKPDVTVQEKYTSIVLPGQVTDGNPAVLVLEWSASNGRVR